MPTVAKAKDLKIKPTRNVHAEPDRAEVRIVFPKLAGYRIELPDERLYAAFSEDSHMTLTTEDMPTQTVVSGLIGATGTHTLDELKAKRGQEIAYTLAQRIMEQLDQGQDPRPWYFPQVLQITKDWLGHCVTYERCPFPPCLLIAHNSY